MTRARRREVEKRRAESLRVRDATAAEAARARSEGQRTAAAAAAEREAAATAAAAAAAVKAAADAKAAADSAYERSPSFLAAVVTVQSVMRMARMRRAFLAARDQAIKLKEVRQHMCCCGSDDVARQLVADVTVTDVHEVQRLPAAAAVCA